MVSINSVLLHEILRQLYSTVNHSIGEIPSAVISVMNFTIFAGGTDFDADGIRAFYNPVQSAPLVVIVIPANRPAVAIGRIRVELNDLHIVDNEIC